MVGTDGLGIPNNPSLGKFHPRFYGTYPRILGKYVREEKLLTLEDAIRRMTSFPAKRLGLNDRGLLKEKYWDWGSGDILDENNQIIGKMKRVILSIRRRVELQEIDGTVAATIHAKIVSARGAQDLKDPQGNLIARIKKKILSFFRPVFYLEDPQGNQWFRAQGKFMGFSFKVYDVTTGNVVAEIEKADRWRDLFLGGLLDFKDTYALRILDNETDRRILVGFVLSIDNVLHDY